MRYLTVRIHPGPAGAFHPVGRRLAAEPSITREAFHHVELLDDGTVLTLAEGSGDRDRYEELMAASAHVEEFLVTGEERWMATSQFQAREPIRRLLEWRREMDLVVETPITVDDDGSVRITYLGSQRPFSELYDRGLESDVFDLEVLETGPYEPELGPLVRGLTSRQREVLRAAVEEGYYSNPREATHEAVADAVGLAPSTVGDHLREIETRVFTTLLR